MFIVRHQQVYCQKFQLIIKKRKLNELCDDAKSYFDKDIRIIDKKWLFLKKLFKKKNISRKECLLLPFKTLKKIVSK